MKGEVYDTLEKAISAAGSAVALAKILHLKHSMAISHWKKRGRVPKEHLLAIFYATGVTPHELRPDIHPNPTSGLPINQQINTQTNEG
ncbi:Rha family transcriptional regulator [Buttiauxella sp. 3AFRM03]|uniref:transcriptional regulator n=1 Tax=Buttiauxella sp. 3AFRM03 TaxID=2479367 RepID=UPI000EF8183C|nr:YdaS family helix-turn-helix protein [Buttiauxella sp. 3AFRM03]AYN26723.1 Rha family transcriptional regulator [Buttiauxella sp. 3AFRM03]